MYRKCLHFIPPHFPSCGSHFLSITPSCLPWGFISQTRVHSVLSMCARVRVHPLSHKHSDREHPPEENSFSTSKAPQLRRGCSSLYAGTLGGLVLRRSYADKHSSCAFLSATALLYPEDSFLTVLPQPLAFKIFQLPLLQSSLSREELCEEDVSRRAKNSTCIWSLHSDHLWGLSIDPLQSKLSLMRDKNCRNLSALEERIHGRSVSNSLLADQIHALPLFSPYSTCEYVISTHQP